MGIFGMEDLQSLLEKINRDGVEKADAEAKRIIDEAKNRADALLKKAQEDAARAKADADQTAAAYAERAKESVSQAARDVVLGVKDAVTALLEKALVKEVDKTLSDEKTVLDLVSTALKDLTGPGEVTCAPALAKALAARLAATGSFTVVTNASQGTGFTVRLDGGRVEHTFTGEVISAELAKRLRPDLAALLK